METIEILYIIFSATLSISGLILVGISLRAYKRTYRTDMILLSLGFALIVSAAIGTTISAFLSNFAHPQLLLTINYFITTIGFLLLITSLIIK
ncbi:putative membrane protein [Methanonatronarchaeum thermophilum]|uniref:Putative membrane protein n=1 Tax=Methanonatronarchaeum thermophilum TaxID=1927129 RepID=A0A1Y3GG46_9EURY|nr:hypothetical protein [Methanonatronarchaeum thermophilum]OUJ18346.1 putative membrane protein [Methanonatronarchaeum thermophilum]